MKVQKEFNSESDLTRSVCVWNTFIFIRRTRANSSFGIGINWAHPITLIISNGEEKKWNSRKVVQPRLKNCLSRGGGVGGDKDYRLSWMIYRWSGCCFFLFKPYMNRDVASPLPPSGLRSLLAVCVPLMHSHSLACSCKTSRDLSKFPPLQTFLWLILFCIFFAFFFVFLIM